LGFGLPVFYSTLHTIQIKRLGPPVVGPNPMPELTHVVVAMESTSHQNLEDFFPIAVLNSLMGGGSSFSPGGPGKGMYTQLYTTVLNQHHWAYSAIARNHSYIDSGLFAIYGSSHPSHVRCVVCSVNIVCAFEIY